MKNTTLPTKYIPELNYTMRAIDVLPSGKVVWPVMGGSGEGGGPGDGGAGDGGNGDGDKGGSGAGGDDPDDIDDGNTDAKKANDAAKKWRARADKDRADAKDLAKQVADLKAATEKQRDAIAIAMGLKPEEATPEELAKKLEEAGTTITAAQAAEKGAKLELGIFKAAGKLEGVEAEDLLDSRSFMAAASDLDPADEKFADKIKKLIKDRHPDAKERDKSRSNGNGGYSAPVGGNSGGSSNKDENDPRALADRIASGSNRFGSNPRKR